MPKKVKKKQHIAVSSKKQGYWVKKENKKSGERMLKAKGDKVLVKRNRSGYEYSRDFLVKVPTKTNKKKKQILHVKISKVKHKNKNPIITAKGFQESLKKKKSIDLIDELKKGKIPKVYAKDIERYIDGYMDDYVRDYLSELKSEDYTAFETEVESCSASDVRTAEDEAEAVKNKWKREFGSATEWYKNQFGNDEFLELVIDGINSGSIDYRINPTEPTPKEYRTILLKEKRNPHNPFWNEMDDIELKVEKFTRDWYDAHVGDSKDDKEVIAAITEDIQKTFFDVLTKNIANPDELSDLDFYNANVRKRIYEQIKKRTEGWFEDPTYEKNIAKEFANDLINEL